MSGTVELEVTADHAVPVTPAAGGTLTILNQSGDSLYYGDTAQVSAASNQGSLTAAQSATLSLPQWIRSASLTTVQVTFIDPAAPSSGGGGGSLATLSDVAESTPVRGQSLRYNGTKWANEGEAVFYASDYGVVANGRTVTDAAITSGQATLSSAQAAFSTAPTPSSPTGDLNKLVVVIGAGAAGAHLYTTISSIAGGVATLAASAGTTVAGGEAFYATDDTTAAQNCLTAAGAVGGVAMFPFGDAGLSAALSVPAANAISIKGQGVLELWDTADTVDAANFPSRAPYLKGSVLVQCAANTDILDLHGTGLSQNLQDLGLRFAGRYLSTGHGVNADANGSVTSYGLMGGHWTNVRVFGVDGNHYGFISTSPELLTHSMLRSYGGGGIHYAFTHDIQSGNVTSLDFYAITLVNGSAHAMYLDGTHGNECIFVRPQTWVYAPTTQPTGTSPPTSAQACLAVTGGTGQNDMGFISHDFETNVGSATTFPSGPRCYRTSAPLTSLGNASPNGNPTSGTGFQNLYGTAVDGYHEFTLQPVAAATASTTLTAGAAAGASTLTVAAITGFAAGQCVQIGDSSHDSGAIDYAFVVSAAGSTITLYKFGNSGLDFAHASGASVQAGAAMIIGEIAPSNSFPSQSAGRFGRFTAPIGASQTVVALNCRIFATWWTRLQWANATRTWTSYAPTLG